MRKNRGRHKKNKDVESQSTKKTWWDRVKSFFAKKPEILIALLGAFLTTLVTIIKEMETWNYAKSCRDFYGISEQYFLEDPFWEKKSMILLGITIFFLLILVYGWMTEKEKNKEDRVLCKVGLYFLLVLNGVVCGEGICEYLQYKITIKLYYLCIYIVLCMLSAAGVVFYFSTNFNSWKKAKKCIIVFLMGLYVVIVSINLALELRMDVSDKTMYETIDEQYVIVAEYKNMFVLMECETEENTIKIHKGYYTLAEMENKIIRSKEYSRCICE